MIRNFPIKVNVRENRLAASCHGLLRKFEDEHLGELFDLPVIQLNQIGGKEEVHCVPPDGSRKITLKGSCKFHHVCKQNFRVLSGFCNGEGIGQVEAEFFYILEGLSGTVRPVHKTQVVQVDIAAHVCIADRL